MNPKPHQFVLLSNRGPIAVGIFDKPPWHKKEKENLFKELDIQIKYGSTPCGHWHSAFRPGSCRGHKGIRGYRQGK